MQGGICHETESQLFAGSYRDSLRDNRGGRRSHCCSECEGHDSILPWNPSCPKARSRSVRTLRSRSLIQLWRSAYSIRTWIILRLSSRPKFRANFDGWTRTGSGFFPEVTFAPSTVYTAKVLPTVSHSPHRVLSGNRTLSFATERFKVKKSKLSFERGAGRKSRAKIHADG